MDYLREEIQRISSGLPDRCDVGTMGVLGAKILEHQVRETEHDAGMILQTWIASERSIDVDDTPSNLLLVRRILERRRKVTLLTAGRGDDGIRLANESRPSLILLDLHLPDMHGDSVLQRLWEEPATRNIPVVIVSADATPATAQRVVAHGAVNYLSKPLDIHRLLRLIDEYCRG